METLLSKSKVAQNYNLSFDLTHIDGFFKGLFRSVELSTRGTDRDDSSRVLFSCKNLYSEEMVALI